MSYDTRPVVAVAVADAMLAARAVAVEHGEKVYDSRVSALETELANALRSGCDGRTDVRLCR